MKKEKLEQLALKIISLEEECQQNKNVEKNLIEMEKLTMTLSLEDMLAIDEYITKNYWQSKKFLL